MEAKMEDDKDISRISLWYSYTTRDHPIELKSLKTFYKEIIKNSYREQLR